MEEASIGEYGLYYKVINNCTECLSVAKVLVNRYPPSEIALESDGFIFSLPPFLPLVPLEASKGVAASLL